MTDQEEFERFWKIHGQYFDSKSKTLSVWQAATEAAKPKWVPVSEGLPKMGGWFPVLCGLNLSFQKGYFDIELKKFDLVKLNKNPADCKAVTHWYELPELPE